MPGFLIAVHLKGGLIRTRSIFLKIITSAVTISSGGSAGVESPIAQVGGAVGSSIGRFFSMSSHRLKVLIACGAAAGIAAQFNAPLAGVLFAQEIIMIGQFQLHAFGIIVISSGLATAISRAYYSNEPTFGALSYSLSSYWELPLYIVMGLVIGFLAAQFIRFFYWVDERFKALPLHENLKPIFGAFLVGLLGLVAFEVLGDGYEAIQLALNGQEKHLLWFFVGLFFLKILATSITLGSGNVGGLFGPSLYFGAMAGAAFGGLAQWLFPAMGLQPGSYALVGMGAFLAATTHAPMTAIFLLFELTNNYQVILPVMFASVIGVMLAKRVCEDNLDSRELSRRGIVLHLGREENLLNRIHVEEVMVKEVETLPENMTFADFMQIFPNSKAHYYPLLDPEGRLSGIVSFQDIREIMLEEGLEHLVVMKELAETQLIKLHPHDNLNEAIRKFGIKDIESIPVVDPQEEDRLLGIVKRKDVMDAYNRAVLLKTVKQPQLTRSG